MFLNNLINLNDKIIALRKVMREWIIMLLSARSNVDGMNGTADCIGQHAVKKVMLKLTEILNFLYHKFSWNILLFIFLINIDE